MAENGADSAQDAASIPGNAVVNDGGSPVSAMTTPSSSGRRRGRSDTRIHVLASFIITTLPSMASPRMITDSIKNGRQTGLFQPVPIGRSMLRRLGSSSVLLARQLLLSVLLLVLVRIQMLSLIRQQQCERRRCFFLLIGMVDMP